MEEGPLSCRQLLWRVLGRGGLGGLHVVSRHEGEGQPVGFGPNPPAPEPMAAGGGGRSRAQGAPPAGPCRRRGAGGAGGPGYFYTDPVPPQRPFSGWAAALCWKHLRGERAAGGLSNHRFLYISECGPPVLVLLQDRGRLAWTDSGEAPFPFPS